jgi:hypothetical protein
MMRATTVGWEIVCPQPMGIGGIPICAPHRNPWHEEVARDALDRIEHALVQHFDRRPGATVVAHR